MAFKDEWRPRVDGVDELNTSAVNEIAAEVIKQEEDIAKQQEQIEEIKEQISNNEGNEDFATKTYVDKEISKSETRANQIYSNALKGTATGENVAITDVSPIEHEISVEVTSNNIPLYPYTINQNHIGGVPYEIKTDGTIHISGACEESKDYGNYVIVKEVYTPAGKYTVSGNIPSVNEGAFYFGTEEEGVMIEAGKSSHTFTVYSDRYTHFVIFPTTSPTYEYDISIKPLLSKGAEIAPEVSNAEIIVSDENNNQKTYYTDANGYVTVKSMYPTTIISAESGLSFEVKYNQDINSVIGDVETALDNIIAQQESIIEIQNAIIGGGNE